MAGSSFRELSLLELQDKTKRDPESYREEFFQQWRRCKQLHEIILLNSKGAYDDFVETLRYTSNVAFLYPESWEELVEMILNFISNHCNTAEPEVRLAVMHALIVIRTHNIIPEKKAVPLLLSMLRHQDKTLRNMVHSHLVAKIKRDRIGVKGDQSSYLRRSIFEMTLDPCTNAACKALEIIMDIFMRGVWRDSSTVMVIANACLSQFHKVAICGVHFFLGKYNKSASEEVQNDTRESLSLANRSMKVGKSTNAKKRALDRLKSKVKKYKFQNEITSSQIILMITSPYEFAESLFSKARRTSGTINFETRLLYLDLVTRLISVHKFVLVQFYEFIISYLKPRQKEISSLLAYTVQSSHDMVPPDLIMPILKCIADNFVWNNVASEIQAMGLNAIREICVRCPLSMPEDLLESLISDYRNYRERPPREAARSLLNFYRKFNPAIVKRKYRGKKAAMEASSIELPRYAEQKITGVLDGIDNKNSSHDQNISDDQNISEDDQNISEDDQNISENDQNISEDDQNISEDDLSENLLNKNKMGNNHSIEVNTSKKLNINAQTELLTDQQFAKIRQAKNQDTSSTSDEENEDIIVPPERLTKGTTRSKDYESRMARVKMGREGRTYGSKKGKTERGSKSNKIKNKKNKNFIMVLKGRGTRSKSRSLVKGIKRRFKKK